MLMRRYKLRLRNVADNTECFIGKDNNGSLQITGGGVSNCKCDDSTEIEGASGHILRHRCGISGADIDSAAARQRHVHSARHSGVRQSGRLCTRRSLRRQGDCAWGQENSRRRREEGATDRAR
eukprot:1781756-Rhodomonas_salina.1